jgi:hypothetical protein
MSINEATLEARIHKVLDITFPTFRQLNIEHQNHFSVRLGHHDVTVDHDPATTKPVQGKLDILLKSGAQNLILLELKKEGAALTPKDMEQGLSYARLLHQMPPLVLISNGHANEFYNTYTAERLLNDRIDMPFIQQMVDNSFAIAMNDFRHAVNVLINKEPELFSQVVTRISKNRLEQYSGPVNDLFKPICPEFQIQRNIVQEIYNAFEAGENLIGLIGAAFSGKTNVLYQFYTTYSQKCRHYLFFLDALDAQYPILQQLATQFSRETKVSINKDKIREWLNNSLQNDTETRFFLLIDNFNKDLSEETKAEVYELIDMFSGSQNGILYTIDEFSYKEIAVVSGRPYDTVIGSKSKLFLLNELNIIEFERAMHGLIKAANIVIQLGGQYATEYRLPRILRQLAAIYKQVDFKENQGSKIQPIPDLEFLRLFSNNNIYSQKTQDLHKVMAGAFVLDAGLRDQSPQLNIAAMTTGAISTYTMENSFRKEFIKLIRKGFVITRTYQTGMRIMIPKLPELLAFHSIGVIFHLIKDQLKKEAGSSKIYDILIKYTRFVPYGDIIATDVLHKISAIDAPLFSTLVTMLINHPPLNDKINPGATVMLFEENIGPIVMEVPEDPDDENSSIDSFEWSVLSQVAGYPMELLNDDKHHPRAFNFYLLNTLGSYNDFIPRYDFHSLGKQPDCGFHHIEGQGRYVCEKSGIVEPIVQAIQKFFFKIGDDFDYLSERAFEEKNTFLLWRIYLAIQDMETLVESDLASRARIFNNRFTKEYKQLFC